MDVRAHVLAWEPVGTDGVGDIAVLTLEHVPQAARPARLLRTEDLWDHRFRTFGFPAQRDDGVWASGLLRTRQATGWVQMEGGGTTGYRVESGFSGAPVWDDDLDGVVGMVVAAESRAETRASYLIPTRVLTDAWPGLADATLPVCPYRGLYAFRERDSHAFFGREDTIEILLSRVSHRPFVALVGASGSGKSSLVFAGLLPRLRRAGQWLVAVMHPGQASSPLAALAGAFAPLLDPDASELSHLEAIPRLTAVFANEGLAEVVDRSLSIAGADRLLLVVDQFEEGLVRGSEGSAELSRTLLDAVPSEQGTGSGLTVLITLRADFLERALEDPALGERLEDAVTAVGRIGRRGLREVIEDPMPAEVRCEAGLVDRILSDVGESSAALPLLEFTMTMLWDLQQHHELTHEAYVAIGGVGGALATYAEDVYSELPSDDQARARRLLLQLIRPGDAFGSPSEDRLSEDVQRPVRRIARRSDLGEPLWPLAQRLAATRLLVVDRDASGVESVELAHEALISEWDRLRDWVAEDIDFRSWQERTRAALSQWEADDRDPGGLLRGRVLADAEQWLATREPDVGAEEHEFIKDSRRLASRSRHRAQVVYGSLALSLAGLTVVGAYWAAGQAQEASMRNQAIELGPQAPISGGTPDLPQDAELPVYREVEVPKFLLDVHEVTNEQYKWCVDAGACAPPHTPAGRQPFSEGDEQLPVVFVTAYEARDYCRWIDRRLPTAEEWALAASELSDEVEAAIKDPNAGTFANLYLAGRDGLVRVDSPDFSSGRTTDGVADLFGNASEWVATQAVVHGRQPIELRTWDQENPVGDLTVVGGSYTHQVRETRVTVRADPDLEAIDGNVGFRCAESE